MQNTKLHTFSTKVHRIRHDMPNREKMRADFLRTVRQKQNAKTAIMITYVQIATIYSILRLCPTRVLLFLSKLNFMGCMGHIFKKMIEAYEKNMK